MDNTLEKRIKELTEELSQFVPYSDEYAKICENLEILMKLKLKDDEISLKDDEIRLKQLEHDFKQVELDLKEDELKIKSQEAAAKADELELKKKQLRSDQIDQLIKSGVRLLEIGMSISAVRALIWLSVEGFKFEEENIFGSKNFTETRGMVRNCLMKLFFK